MSSAKEKNCGLLHLMMPINKTIVYDIINISKVIICAK